MWINYSSEIIRSKFVYFSQFGCVMEIGAKGYKDTAVHFQTAENLQSEEKAKHLQYLEILVLNKKLKLSYIQTILTW